MPLLQLDAQGTGPRLLWLHGFTHTRHTAAPLLSILAGSYRVVTLDLPGHGDSADIALDLPGTASAICAAIGDEPLIIGGYSLGGRVALHIAAQRPDLLRGLVLLSTSRGINDDLERAKRRQRDEDLAQRILEIGTAAFLDEWLRQPLFAGLEDSGERSQSAAGLAASLQLCGVGTQQYFDGVGAWPFPILAMAGEHDHKYVSEAHAIAASCATTAVIVPEATHAAHLQQPEWCAQAIADFAANCS